MPRASQILSRIWVIGLAVTAVACRNGTDLETARTSGGLPNAGAVHPTPVPTESQGVPVEVEDGLAADRSYLPSRGTIVINISPDIAEPGDALTLTNETSGSTLMEQSTLALAAYDLTLRLYPTDPSFAGKFVIGPNKLRLLSNNTRGLLESFRIINRKDFPLLVTAGGTFSTQTERSGGLELRPGTLRATAVTNGSKVLIVDPITMMNR